MSDHDLFFDSQHAVSRRFVVFEDNGTSAWLYLTAPETRQPIADVWVYNRIPAPSTSAISSYRGGPPPAAIGFCSDAAMCETPADFEWSFVWSDDGESVAIAKEGIPVAYVLSGHKQGFSRELIKNGPWGNTWSEDHFARCFCRAR